MALTWGLAATSESAKAEGIGLDYVGCLSSAVAGCDESGPPSDRLASSGLVSHSKASNLESFRMTVGNDGYAVMAYLVRKDHDPSAAAVIARVRKPGATKFGPPRYLGISSGDWLALRTIGSKGLTMLAYRNLAGELVIQQRWPGERWYVMQRMEGLPFSDVDFSVAKDGTVVASDLEYRGKGDDDNAVFTAIRDRRSGSFDPWQQVSVDPGSVGESSSVVAYNNGHSLVTWTEPCSSGMSTVLNWADSGLYGSSFPLSVTGTDCATGGVEMQKDARGNVYIRLDLRSRVRFLFHGAGRFMVSPWSVVPRIGGKDGVRLNVDPAGRATLIWRGSTKRGRGGRAVYAYESSRNGSDLSKAKWIRAPWMRGGNVRLRDVASLPGGRIAMVFTQVRKMQRGWKSERIGTTVWEPGSVLKQPKFGSATKKGQIIGPVGIETSPDGGRITWWGTQSKATGKTLGYWWRMLAPLFGEREGVRGGARI